jgi:hypothetical protein
MTDIQIVTDPAKVSPEWLTQVLQSSGALAKDRRVEACHYKPIGTGQVSDSFRFTLTLSPGAEAPGSVVLKLPAANETSRMAGENLGLYFSEVSFYQDFAAKLDMRTPACHFASIAENKVDFSLVMEDVAPAQQGDQMEGCTLDQARLAVTEVTKLHAPFYNSQVLKQTGWLNKSADNSAVFRPMLQDFYKGFCERYADRIEPEIIAMGERYYGGMDDLAEEGADPFSLVHTDYRLDNMLFATQAGGPPITVVDWQTVTIGSPLSDVAFFIGAGLHVEERRAHEEKLVRLYHETMMAAGITNLEWEKCWDLYRVNSFAGFMMAVMASQLVERTDRGDEMFITMGRRHGQQILDLDAEALLIKK